MKKNYSILTLAVIIFFASCKKDSDMQPELQKTVLPTITKDPSKNQVISFSNINNFNGAVVVDIYFKDKPKSLDLMVSFNGNPRNVGVIKSGITEFPTTVSFDINALADAVSRTVPSLVPGNYFRIYSLFTLNDGTTVSGVDTLYSAYFTSINSLPKVSLKTDYTVVLP